MAANRFLLLLGVAILVDPRASNRVDPLGATVLILAALSWAIGSLYARRAPLPSSPLLATAMELLAGGLVLMVAGADHRSRLLKNTERYYRGKTVKR